MSFSLKKVSFLFLFSVFQILLVFVFSTSYELPVLAAYILMLVVFFRFFKMRFTLDKRVFYIFISVAFFSALSFFNTVSIPLSIPSFLHFLAGIVIILFFSSFKTQKNVKVFELVYTFLVLGVVLSLLFLISLFSSSTFGFLPTINTLTLTYGHSHFAAYLLLLIPIAWWFFLSNKFPEFKYRQSALILFYLVLFFTFGRLALAIAFFQLLYISFFAFKNKLLGVRAKGILLFLFFSIFLFFGFFLSGVGCSIPELKPHLCKDFATEPRPHYFGTAIRAIQSSSIIGFGPGSYEIISKRFNILPKYNSIYAHSFFLHFFAENGLIAGFLYSLFFFTVVFLIVKKHRGISKTSPLRIYDFLTIGFISIFFNSFADFDWNMFPTFQFSLIYLALLLPSESKIDVFPEKLQKFIFYFISYIILFFGLLALSSQVLLFFKNENFAFDVYPFFYQKSRQFIKSKDFSEQRKNYFYVLYKNHFDYVMMHIEDATTLDEKRKLYDHATFLYPWNTTNENYLQVLHEVGDYNSLAKNSHLALSYLEKTEKYDYHFYDIRSKVLEKLLIAVEGIFESGDKKEAHFYLNFLLGYFYNVKSEESYRYLYNDNLSTNFGWQERIYLLFQKVKDEDRMRFYDLMNNLMNMYEKSDTSKYFESPYLGREVAILLAESANESYLSKKYEEASQFYNLAHKYDRWVFNNIDPSFLVSNSTVTPEFWMSLTIPGEDYGRYRAEALQQLSKTLEKVQQLNNSTQILEIEKLIDQFQY